MSNPSTRDRPSRRTTRQAAAGAATRAATRRQVLAAAIEVIGEVGYAPATVAKIADRADVSVQTLYSAWGNKRGLLRGMMSALVMGDLDGDLQIGSLPPGVTTDLGTATPSELIAHFVHEWRVLGERAAVGWRAYAQASAVDPDAAADWHELMAVRRTNIGLALEQMDLDLRPGMSLDQAADTVWAIASPQVWDLMVDHGGCTVDDLEQWLVRTITVALLGD